MESPGFECYIYGSQHDKKPDVSRFEFIAKQVDLVLLEGLYMDWEKLSMVWNIYYLLFLWLLAIFRFTVLKGVDMSTIRSFFKERGVKAVVADRKLSEVVGLVARKTEMPAEIKRGYIMIRVTQVIIPIVLLLIALLFFGVQLPTIILLTILIISIISATILEPWAFALKTMSYRDDAIVEKVLEARRNGLRGVFIARGKKHVKFIVEKLRKYSIYCREVV